MVELLEPAARAAILELAAGPGEVGFARAAAASARRRADLDRRRAGDGRRPPAGAPRSSASTDVRFARRGRRGDRPARTTGRRRPLPLRTHARPGDGAGGRGDGPRDAARRAGGARRLGGPAASTPGSRPPGEPRSSSASSSRPTRRRRGRSGSATPTGSGRVVARGGLEIGGSRTSPSRGWPGRSTSGGRRRDDISLMLSPLLERLSPGEIDELRERRRGRCSQEYVADDGSLTVPGRRAHRRRAGLRHASRGSSCRGRSRRARPRQRRRVLAVEDRIHLDDLERADHARLGDELQARCASR